MNITIVLPTYNEEKNIENLLRQLNQIRVPGYSLSVLIVDDNSPDGTGERVNAFMKQYSNVYLLSRVSKLGIGSAYVAGFVYAIETLKADYILQMDADLSHSPEYIPMLIAKLADGYNVVIGSRYTQGGSVAKDWPKIRYMNSKICNYWTKWILSLHSVKDRTAGFKIIDAAFIRNMQLSNFFTPNYSFQIALLYALYLQNARIVEVPIVFRQRSQGYSKMRPLDTIELLWHAIRLRNMQKGRLLYEC